MTTHMVTNSEELIREYELACLEERRAYKELLLAQQDLAAIRSRLEECQRAKHVAAVRRFHAQKIVESRGLMPQILTGEKEAQHEQ